MRKTYIFKSILVLTVFNALFAQSYLENEESKAFQVTLGYKNLHYITNTPYQVLNIDYAYKGKFTSGLHLACTNLSEHLFGGGPNQRLYVYRLGAVIEYMIIDKDNTHLPFNISLNADVGTVLEYYDDDLTGVTNKQFYNTYGAGFTFSSKTVFYKISQNLLGGISLKIMPKHFYNVPDDFYMYFIGFENTLYSKLGIDLKYKKILLSLYTERYKPLEFIFKQSVAKAYTHGIDISYLFPMN